MDGREQRGQSSTGKRRIYKRGIRGDLLKPERIHYIFFCILSMIELSYGNIRNIPMNFDQIFKKLSLQNAIIVNISSD